MESDANGFERKSIDLSKGMVNYYRRFIKSFASKTWHLRELTRLEMIGQKNAVKNLRI